MSSYNSFMLLISTLLLVVVNVIGAETEANESTASEEENMQRYQLFKWKWEEVKFPLAFSFWVLLAAYAKIRKLSAIICCLYNN